MNRVEVVKWFKDPILLQKLYILAKRANFARVRSARGWGLAYQASSIDLPHQSHTLDPALKASRARRTPAIRLLVNDFISLPKDAETMHFVAEFYVNFS